MGVIWSALTDPPTSETPLGAGRGDRSTAATAVLQPTVRSQEDEARIVVDALVAFLLGKVPRQYKTLNRATNCIKKLALNNGFWARDPGPGSHSVMSLEGYRHYICRMAATRLRDQGAFKIIHQGHTQQTRNSRHANAQSFHGQSPNHRERPAHRRGRLTTLEAALPQSFYQISFEQRGCYIEEAVKQEEGEQNAVLGHTKRYIHEIKKEEGQ